MPRTTPKPFVAQPHDYDLANWPHSVKFDEMGMGTCLATSCPFVGDLRDAIVHIVKNPAKVR